MRGGTKMATRGRRVCTASDASLQTRCRQPSNNPPPLGNAGPQWVDADGLPQLWHRTAGIFLFFFSLLLLSLFVSVLLSKYRHGKITHQLHRPARVFQVENSWPTEKQSDDAFSSAAPPKCRSMTLRCWLISMLRWASKQAARGLLAG